MSNNIKHTSFILVLILITAGFNNLISGDNDSYIQYALKAKDFDTTGFFISKGSDHEINIKNSTGSILKFRVNDKDELLTYHCGIAFIYFEFASGWLARYKTLDKNGELKGDDEFEDLAIVEYEIKKMNFLIKK